MAALVVEVALVVAGCTDSSSPKPSPLPSATASSSAAPSPSAPALPAEAKGTSAASAKAFARYYVDLINHASMSGETTDLRAASTKKCSTCEVIANEIERPYKNGGHLEGGSWTPGLASVGLSSRKTSALVSFPVRIAKQIEYAPSGKPAKTVPSATGNLDLRLIRLSGAWMVDRLDAKQS